MHGLGAGERIRLVQHLDTAGELCAASGNLFGDHAVFFSIAWISVDICIRSA